MMTYLPVLANHAKDLDGVTGSWICLTLAWPSTGYYSHLGRWTCWKKISLSLSTFQIKEQKNQHLKHIENCHVHGLKCPCYPNWFIDLIKRTSKFQWHLLQKYEKILNTYGSIKRPRMAKAILNNKKQSWEHHNISC